jgi:hypothetical protein
MPLYVMECDKCGCVEEALIPAERFDGWKESLPECMCNECGNVGLHIRICAPTRVPGGKREYNRMMKERFKKRNKRIQSMPKENRERFKDFIRERNIKRSW